MYKKLIRKISFKKTYLQLRGAKILKEKNDPFFVSNTVSSLSEVSLDLNEKDFPRCLVGSHAAKVEILLRQAFLKRYSQVCTSLMYSIGSGKPLIEALPPSWIAHIKSKGIKSSLFFSSLKLYFLALANVIIGCKLFFVFLIQVKFQKRPESPYVVFIDLQKNNLPITGEIKSCDIISWYKNSKIRTSTIKEIWAQAVVNKSYIAEPGLFVTQFIFPKINLLRKYIIFLLKGITSLFVAIIGILRGRWWYGYLYRESITLHYICSLSSDSLAEDYYFHNSGWFYKPLWTYEVEKKGSKVSLYYYSTNMKQINFNEYVREVTYGLKSMSWERFLVWDQYQEDYLKQFCPMASFIKVGYLDFSGKPFINNSKENKRILSIFDVTPTRQLKYISLGYAIPPYYSEELNLKFLEEIIKAVNTKKWLILWKPKRVVGSDYVSNTFKRKQASLTEKYITKVKPDISANSLVENSDAVISMPFSSPSVYAKIKGIPSIFYDASKQIKIDKIVSHNILIVKNKIELEEWCQSLKLT